MYKHKYIPPTQGLEFLEPTVAGIAPHIPDFLHAATPVLAIDRFSRRRSAAENGMHATKVFRAAVVEAGFSINYATSDSEAQPIRDTPFHADFPYARPLVNGIRGVATHTSDKKAQGLFVTSLSTYMTGADASEVERLHADGIYREDLTRPYFYAGDIPKGVTTVFHSIGMAPTLHGYTSIGRNRNILVNVTEVITATATIG